MLWICRATMVWVWRWELTCTCLHFPASLGCESANQVPCAASIFNHHWPTRRWGQGSNGGTSPTYHHHAGSGCLAERVIGIFPRNNHTIEPCWVLQIRLHGYICVSKHGHLTRWCIPQRLCQSPVGGQLHAQHSPCWKSLFRENLWVWKGSQHRIAQLLGLLDERHSENPSGRSVRYSRYR